MAFSSDQILLHGDIGYRADTSLHTATTPGAPGRLWLPIWSGEVINAYDEYNMFESMVTSRSIASGMQMEFPITGTVGLNAVWSAGEELGGGSDKDGNSPISDSFVVTLDKRPMAAHFELDNIDQMVSQWEYRAELARQAGLRLASTRDRQLASFVARAVCNSIELEKSAITTLCLAFDEADGGSTGSASTKWGTVTAGVASTRGMQPRHQFGFARTRDNFQYLGSGTASAANRTTAALELLQYVEDFLVRQQEANIPEEPYFLVVEPRTFQDIRALGVARATGDLDDGGRRPFFGGTEDMGGLGAGLSQGMFGLGDTLVYMGVTIVKSNHLPVANYATVAATNPGASPDTNLVPVIGEDKYNVQGLEAGIKALMFTASSIASIRLQGLKVDTVDDVRRNTTFTVASMMGGTGILKPECTGVVLDGIKYKGSATAEVDAIGGGALEMNETDTDDLTLVEYNSAPLDAASGCILLDLYGNALFNGAPALDIAYSNNIPAGLGAIPGAFVKS
mgnify:CR=1 FL=1|tara:strand:- start:4108 stop:5637 length:1530 start_codon:yes stop_codon:yes gene_type:complete